MLKKNIRLAVFLFAIIYACILSASFFFQRNMMYFPPIGLPPLEEAAAQGYEIVQVKTEDGLTLKTLYKAPESPNKNPKGAILVFHGNGSSALYERHRTDFFNSLGLAVMLGEYRGYSHNEGKPTESGLIKDAQAQYEALMARGFKPENIYLYGHSLGTAVSLALAENKKVGGIILETPFLSALTLAHGAIHFMPDFLINIIMRDNYRSDERITKIDAPFLFLIAGKDTIVPNESSEALYNLARGKKEKAFFPTANHVNIWDFDVHTPIRKFMEDITQ
ncbi:MAG: alpha/beta fold hydrolase [Alphaproteobacteria bacterium]|nr:alpha/beta fold hydrolase [Alphaproteobacteria bacterium]